MRESCSGDDVTVMESSPGVQESNICRVRHTSRRRKWRHRSIGSRSLLLILAWVFIICCSLNLTLKTMKQYKSNLSPEKKENPAFLWLVEPKYALVISSVIVITIPIASLLAEVVIGRYKLVIYTLKGIWLLSIVGNVLTLCGKTLPVADSMQYNIHLIILLLQYMLMGAHLSSAIPLGIDQISSGSDANISAFIVWLVWTIFSGLVVPSIVAPVLYSCTHFQTSEVSMVMSLLPVLLLSVGLILDFHFHHKLVKEPVTVNPVSLIFKVLKYAAKHKYPVQRSAFTYCENERPTRLDYGKSKYGGPFTTEQVEDVKTFGRVLVVIVVIGISAVTFMAQYESQPAMEESFGLLHLKKSFVSSVARQQLIYMSSIMVTIPLYELLIYPCLRNRGPSILQSAGIGAAALIVSSLYGVVTEAILFDGNTGCMFVQNSHNAREVGILINIPFQLILAFAIVVLLKSSTEFVCAQAPYNMKGFLIGLFFTTLIFFVVLGTLLFLVWSNKWLAILGTSTCGIWFYLSTLVLAVVSSALLGLVIRWYKARERDEITRSRDLVEEVYHKYHEQLRHE
jgi:peptide/histidine transporter 3/4